MMVVVVMVEMAEMAVVVTYLARGELVAVLKVLLVPRWSRSWQRQPMMSPRQVTAPRPSHHPLWLRLLNITWRGIRVTTMAHNYMLGHFHDMWPLLSPERH